jgi:hypothetical protein
LRFIFALRLATELELNILVDSSASDDFLLLPSGSKSIFYQNNESLLVEKRLDFLMTSSAVLPYLLLLINRFMPPLIIYL